MPYFYDASQRTLRENIPGVTLRTFWGEDAAGADRPGAGRSFRRTATRTSRPARWSPARWR